MLILNILKTLMTFKACSVNIHQIEDKSFFKEFNEYLQVSGIFAGDQFEVNPTTTRVGVNAKM